MDNHNIKCCACKCVCVCVRVGTSTKCNTKFSSNQKRKKINASQPAANNEHSMLSFCCCCCWCAFRRSERRRWIRWRFCYELLSFLIPLCFFFALSENPRRIVPDWFSIWTLPRHIDYWTFGALIPSGCELPEAKKSHENIRENALFFCLLFVGAPTVADTFVVKAVRSMNPFLPREGLQREGKKDGSLSELTPLQVRKVPYLTFWRQLI